MGIIQNIKINKNLKMAIGQLEGILKMILTKRDSVEVSDQLNAVQALIKSCQTDIIKDEITLHILFTSKTLLQRLMLPTEKLKWTNS